MSVGPSASGRIGPSTVCTWPRAAASVIGPAARRGRVAARGPAIPARGAAPRTPPGGRPRATSKHGASTRSISGRDTGNGGPSGPSRSGKKQPRRTRRGGAARGRAARTPRGARGRSRRSTCTPTRASKAPPWSAASVKMSRCSKAARDAVRVGQRARASAIAGVGEVEARHPVALAGEEAGVVAAAAARHGDARGPPRRCLGKRPPCASHVASGGDGAPRSQPSSPRA